MGTQWAESQTVRHVVEDIKDSIEEGLQLLDHLSIIKVVYGIVFP